MVSCFKMQNFDSSDILVEGDRDATVTCLQIYFPVVPTSFIKESIFSRNEIKCQLWSTPTSPVKLDVFLYWMPLALGFGYVRTGSLSPQTEPPERRYLRLRFHCAFSLWAEHLACHCDMFTGRGRGLLGSETCATEKSKTCFCPSHAPKHHGGDMGSPKGCPCSRG